MKRTVQIPLPLFLLVIVGLLATVGLAIAQAAFEPQIGDPVQWDQLPSYFENPGTLAVLVAFTVAQLRKHLSGVFVDLPDIAGFGVSLGVGLLLGAGSTFTGWSDLSLGAGASLGLGAGFLASGGWDFVKGSLGTIFGGKS